MSLEGSPFAISPHHNSLAMLGCGNSVWLMANETTIAGGCATLCDGLNCCKAPIPTPVHHYKLSNLLTKAVTRTGSGRVGTSSLSTRNGSTKTAKPFTPTHTIKNSCMLHSYSSGNSTNQISTCLLYATALLTTVLFQAATPTLILQRCYIV